MNTLKNHNESDTIQQQLLKYKHKALRLSLLKGFLLWLSISLAIFLILTLSEWSANLNAFNRTALFIVFTLITAVSFMNYLAKPLYQLISGKIFLKDEEAAKKIGAFFPSIKDKLLNYLELAQNTSNKNTLVAASLNQRAKNFENLTFTEAIDLKEGRRNIKYLLPLITIIVLLLLIAPKAFLTSTQRVLHFRKEYVPVAPFTFNISTPLVAYKNENYHLQVELKGTALPQNVWLVEGSNKIQLNQAGVGLYEYNFPQITKNKPFRIEAAGFTSPLFTLIMLERPTMNFLSATLTFPPYVGLQDKILQPAGALELPEGTKVTWNLETQHTEQALFYLNKDTTQLKPVKQNNYQITSLATSSGVYGFTLKAPIAKQKGSIEYALTVDKDAFPNISIKAFTDTLLYNNISFGGQVSDDYGLTSLWLHYQKNGKKMKPLRLPIDKHRKSQEIYTRWPLDSMHLSPGDELSYYIQVFDNDGFNGYKSTKSNRMFYKQPDRTTIASKIKKASNSEKNKIDKAHTAAKEHTKKLDETIRELKSKKELNWKDKQNIKSILKDKEKLQEEVNNLKKQNKLLNEQRNKLQQPSKELQDKAEQLQKLMDELLDDETKQLYEELQKLLQEQAKADEIQSVLNKIQQKEVNLEEELERTLELFKRMQVEQSLEKLTQDLNQLAEQQDSLANQTIDEDNSKEEIREQLEKIETGFKNIQEKLNETKEQNNELKRPNNFEDTSGEEQEIKTGINQSKEFIEKNNRKKSSQNQKNASQNMRSFAKKLQSMQSGMQMEQLQEDVANLRAILANLIILSYQQEKIMVDFRKVNQSDPKFLSLSEQQLKLQDDSKIIKDSLKALASRVLAISSFVTRELNEMDQQLKNSSNAIKERKKGQAGTYQQLSMTSMNNLALMLDNVLDQMQQSMADAMGKGNNKNEQPMPGMSELQKQLNEEIRELQKSGKTGKELSEELAKLAAKQELIRKALRQAEEKLKEESGDKEGGNKPSNLGNLQKQMEQTELDLVNKNITRDLQRRQQQILTRLLEAEKALREQELDTKREAKSALQYDKELPKALEEYLKQKEKEVELLKTVPPKLQPYYKKEVNEYFNRLKDNN